MNKQKIQDIIAGKNEQRERNVVARAADVIESIAHEQQGIVAAQERIKKLREELSKLEVVELDPAAIVGE